MKTPEDKAEPRGVPQEKVERERIRSLVEAYVQEGSLIPPLSLGSLKMHAWKICSQASIPAAFLDFVMVLVGNAVWEESVTTVPFDRRLLLIPQCLRTRKRCPASMDEFGLLCEQCGCCPAGDIVAQAEALGYVVLIAEGTTFVTQLLETGQVEAVIGVGCLDSLEKSFPYAIAAAVPAIAIPLYRDGCDNTGVDVDWIQNYIRRIHDRSDDGAFYQTDIHGTRNLVSGWFTENALHQYLYGGKSETESIAIRSLLAGGKRWRPTLVVSVYKALSGLETIPSHLTDIALAVECFHKASLIHDDIEDEDRERYGLPTLHHEESVAVAINVGDFLLGEGYRLLSSVDVDPQMKVRLFATAVKGHHSLSLGQGSELIQQQRQKMLSVEEVLEIFRFKTAPAFEVALNLGAICAQADESTTEILSDFSRALGVAYQIRDDLEDRQRDTGRSDDKGLRPSLITAMAWEIWDEKTTCEGNLLVDHLKREAFLEQMPELINGQHLIQQAWALFDTYHEESLDILSRLTNQNLKRFLFQITFIILGDASFRRKRTCQVQDYLEPKRVQAT